MSSMIYKIVSADLWQAAEASGFFGGAPIDINDGFIHFSTAAQTRKTAELYFKGQTDLLLVSVDGNTLGEALVYEPSRGGDLFPHLFAPLPMTAVARVVPMPIGPDGNHQFPEDIL